MSIGVLNEGEEVVDADTNLDIAWQWFKLLRGYWNAA